MLAFVVDACIIAKDFKVLKFISCNSHAQLNVAIVSRILNISRTSWTNPTDLDTHLQ